MLNQTDDRSVTDNANGGSSHGVISATAGALEGAASGIERAGHGMGDRVSGAADRTALALLSGADRMRDIKPRELGADLMGAARRHPMRALAAAAAVVFLVTRAVSRR